MYDFTNCLIDRAANYGGSDKKVGIIYHNQRYMLKMSDRIPEERQNALNSSYLNSSLSEYIGCHIIEMIGIPVQETLLGTFTKPSTRGIPRVYPVVVCKNFVGANEELIEFKVIERFLLDTKPSKIPKISDIYEILGTSNSYFSEEFARLSLNRYWDTFILDALLGNFDRHANNWGYLVNKTSEDMRLAPIYDCGSCLYPQITDEAIPGILSNPDELQMRIDKFPNAALELNNGRKANYKQYIASFENKDCTDALVRIFPRIDMLKICEFIDNMEELSDVRKEFYKTMLTMRYEQILERPYELICDREYKEERQEFCLE